MAKKYPNEVTIVCLARRRCQRVSRYKELPKMLRSVHLGGAYNVCGNVVWQRQRVYEPGEADGRDTWSGYLCSWLDVTMEVRMSEENLIKMRDVKCEKEREACG